MGTLRVVGSDALAQLAIETICSNGRINIGLILLSTHSMTPLAITGKLFGDSTVVRQCPGLV